MINDAHESGPPRRGPCPGAPSILAGTGVRHRWQRRIPAEGSRIVVPGDDSYSHPDHERRDGRAICDADYLARDRHDPRAGFGGSSVVCSPHQRSSRG